MDTCTNWQHQTWSLDWQGDSLLVAARGGSALNWRVTGQSGQKISLLDGYATDSELEALSGCRNGVLSPWSNRIADSRYQWSGQDYDRGPTPDGKREAIHGLFLDADFELVSQTQSSLVISAESGPDAGYPARIRTVVTYRIGRDANQDPYLAINIEATNLSDSDAPVALGWHPYFTVSEVDQAALIIPARSRILPDSELIPLPGEAAFEPYAAKTSYSFAGKIVDQAYTELVSDDDGIVRAVLDRGDGSILTLESDIATGEKGVGILHIFTGDTLGDRPRTSVAVEPCQLMTNAFNRSECAAELPLAPGAARDLSAAVIFRQR